MSTNPMHQFNVYRIGPEISLGNVDISFTNASLFMMISALAIIGLFFAGTKRKAIIPTKIQLLTELSYTLVSKMISDTAGSKAKPYFPFIFSLFMFVLFCNMLGMLPYSFTVTSHIIVTFALAAVIFIGVTIIGFINHGVGYLKLFIPSGVPCSFITYNSYNRNYLLLGQTCEFIGTIICKYDGRSYNVKSFWRFRN